MNRKSIIFLLAFVLVAAFLIFCFVVRGPKNTANGDGNATGKDNNTMSGEQNKIERDNKIISGDNARTGNGNLGDTQVSNSTKSGNNVDISIYNNAPSSEPSDAKTSSENSSISESSLHSESSDAKTSNENSSISESSQYQEQPEPNESSQVAETQPVYLANLNPLNYQKHDEDGWHDDYYLCIWEPEINEGADGNKYPKGVLMYVRSGYTDKIRIEYYLNNEYSSGSGKFMLTNGTKSTGVTGKFSIFGTSDDGESRRLYPENQEYIDITGGFPPEPFEIDVNGMEKLTFLVEGEERLDGELGILLADPVLYK